MNGYGDCLKCRSFSKSIFGGLEGSVVSAKVSCNSVSINFKKGQDIYQEGEPARGVFCIQQGKVKLYKKCADRNLITGLAGNSDFLGYQSLFNGAGYIQSAKCLEDSRICFIPRKVFMELASSQQEMVTAMLRLSCSENKKLSEILRDLKCKNMLSRVAMALIAVGEKFGYDDNKCLDITLTRKDISELSGTTTASAIRILNDLKREKVISFCGKRVRIHDATRLLRYQKR
ncbi:MAG: Crp/Fnr family transcriptional regulator [Bacteroidia bacterium]